MKLNDKKLNRREIVKLGSQMVLGAGGLWALAACGNAVSTGATSTAADSSDATGSTACGVIPSETAGPYPAHDDNAINVLRLSGVNRSDIRSSLNTGAYTGSATATGVPLTMKLNLVSASSGCANALAGYAIYVWHCDVNGKYSMYSSGITNQTYLRGVQTTDANGSVTFTSIFPGCYDGRMTHVHFEIYPNAATAVDDNDAVKTSQFTFPTATSAAVYNGTSAYASSVANFANTSFAKDMVFSDGTTYQIATTSGSISLGFTSTLTVAI